MLQCPKQTFARLFYNVSSSFFLLLLFFHFTSIFLANLFIFFGGNPFYQRNQEGCEFGAFSDEEEAEEEEDVYGGSKAVEEKLGVAAPPDVYVGNNYGYNNSVLRDPYESPPSEEESSGASETSGYSTPAATEYDEEEKILVEDTDTSSDPDDPTRTRSFSAAATTRRGGEEEDSEFLVFQPSKSQGKKLVHEIISHSRKLEDDEEIYGDTFTVGSTSKDSSEWRSSSIKDSATDDPFSSSSRRSTCPKWESYAVFHKYDEEMLFFDRITAQKLHETESLKSIEMYPRSLSERIVQKLRTRSRRSTSSMEFRQNPYHELESAYVAQICLTWEALNWNLKYFQRLRASRREFDPGCPACVAQQFQQFQVLLQRYVENEPYENGRRPEIYARMRSLAPKLLQVPEYRDCEEEEEEGQSTSRSTRIPSSSFLVIMEESIRTFMSFLKQDKKSRCEMLADFFLRRRRGTADGTLLCLLKKVNKKKKAKLKEIRRSGKCCQLRMRRRRRLRAEEELEILMAMIDLKVVSRVLRMAEINGEQLHWCENKMGRVRVADGKLHRDSAPLFFPAH
ncbi:uncharacterized protein LOC127263198 [Andrographis paniculata]|uniref:uncharacterized protein LOC127263198 n=1 Tax=Andrographis paniculata TaxID=175694 RepID=UPI0021E7776D|nr:uncharacterized protein LOC127263198 [Andrographis paniculata]